jgi:tRNA pseudouridine38-40 synthase
MKTTKIVLTIEYDGTGYHGFQWQDGLASIQKELETAIKKLTGERCRVMGASRTDAGVHALGQVVSFRTNSSLPAATFISGLNYYLPRDIAVKAAYKTDDSFNVQRDATSREYSYHIMNSPTRSPVREGFAYFVTSPLDIEAANQAAQYLIGEHDLASFASVNGTRLKSTVKRVSKASFQREGEVVTFNMVANSFLPHQVRNTVGALIRVGMGRMSLDEFNSIIEARKPGTAGPTAPACGLYLTCVNYPDNLERDNEDLQP